MPECSHVFHSKCIEEWMEKETENLRQQSLSDPNTRIQIKCALCGVQIRTKKEIDEAPQEKPDEVESHVAHTPT